MNPGFSRFTKASAKPTAEQARQIKEQLLKRVSTEHDQSLSESKGRQLYFTLQSVLRSGNVTSSFTSDRFSLGKPLPYGYSLAYCNPVHLEADLSPDGYDDFNSPTLENQDFFNRRMWVGGEFQFKNDNVLKFGDDVHFQETVQRVMSLNHNDTTFVDYYRTFTNQRGLAQVEKRRICYLYQLYSKGRPAGGAVTEPDESKVIRPSEVTNFRMSALTFNSHLLHYNPDYCRGREGYPKVVLQAPLLFQIALQFWMDKAGADPVRKVKYKVSRPLFVGEDTKVCFKRNDEKKWTLWLENSEGDVCYDSSLTTV